MRRLEYIIGEKDSGKTLKQFLISSGYSREVRTLLKNTDGLSRGGERVISTDILHTGDIIKVCLGDEAPADTVPNAALNAAVVYDDEDVVVFDKPAFMPVHQSMGHNNDTLANYFAAFYPDTVFRAVYRLDRNTSGLVTVGKNKLCASLLMVNGYFSPKKTYFAVVEGDLKKKFGEKGRITAPIAREQESKIKRIVSEDGKYAETLFEVIKSGDSYSLVKIKLVTGRTHQIRVHFSYLGYPLYGDELYGGDTSFIRRQALHCGETEFIHPITSEKLRFVSELPQDMKALIKRLEN